MTVMASVRSMISEPPDGSHTLRSMPFASCSSTRNSAKTSSAPVQWCTRSARSGESSRTYREMVFQACSPETMSSAKSSLKTSRTTRTASSGSPLSSTGTLRAAAALAWISSQIRTSRATSSRSCSSVAPSAAVRTMTPAWSGTISRSSFLRRALSCSGSFREMPVIAPDGTSTR